MPSLLVKVKKKMSIYAHRKVRTALDGEYGSVFKGRSMDFDDLREYVVGDDVKDIDWKGTARSGRTLIRRYVAVRKHNVLLVVDTGRNMAALTPEGKIKRETNIMIAGVLSYIVQKHGDLVALISGDTDNVNYIPFKGDAAHIEQILQKIDKSTRTNANPGRLEALLDYTNRSIRRRTMMIIVTDQLEMTPDILALLRRARAQHEIMLVHVDDVPPTLKSLNNPIDIETGQTFPEYIRHNRHFAKEAQEIDIRIWQATERQLNHLGITHIRISQEADVVARIIELLERQRHAKR